MEPDLQQFVTDDLKADPVAWPIIEKMSEKDVPSVLKSYAHSQHRLGNAIVLPAKPEEAENWKKEHLPKLYKSGILTAPPSDPKEYGIVRPETLPDGPGWNDDLAGKLGITLHKYGAPKELAKDLLDLYGEALTERQAALKTSYDAGVAALKSEHGDKYEERKELAKRLAGQIFKTEEELAFFESKGIGDHPAFLSVLMRLAPLAQQDSSFLPNAGKTNGGVTPEEIRAEVSDIMSNPKNSMHEGWKRRDQKVLDHIDGLYKKLAGDAKVEIT